MIYFRMFSIPRATYKGCVFQLIEIVKKNWLLIMIASVVVVFIFFIDGIGFSDDNEEPLSITPLSSEENHELEEENKTSHSLVVVDVKGEVSKPGIYEVARDARVNDVIQLAGGFTKEANQMHVNLAQIVQDEMVVAVPGMNDELVSEDGGITGSNKVRINYATQEEVETLSGIGPSKAQAIIQYREDHGLFQNAEDLLNISGIGEKTLENLKDDIEVP